MAKVSKAAHFTFRFTIATLIYFLLFFVLPQENVLMQQIWPVLPFWGLVTLGCYAFIIIGKDVMIINDCPDAYNELLKDIQSCKEELQKYSL